LFDGRPFLRPDLPAAVAPRADAVKAGRRVSLAACSQLARPRLDGGEHGVMLAPVGIRRNVLRLNGCYMRQSVYSSGSVVNSSG
jgi:hypothetical protein